MHNAILSLKFSSSISPFSTIFRIPSLNSLLLKTSSAFFFILFCNLLGLIPFGATATSNIMVTAALALVSLAIVESAGFVALGPKGYLKTIFYVPQGLNPAMSAVMLVIMTPVELIGKLAKPFALCVRLFANMTAGHVVILSLIGLIFILEHVAVAAVAVPFALFIYVLELLVAFIQAFIFTLLTGLFIGMSAHPAH